MGSGISCVREKGNSLSTNEDDIKRTWVNESGPHINEHQNEKYVQVCKMHGKD